MAWSFLVWVQAGSGLYFLGILKEKKPKTCYGRCLIGLYVYNKKHNM